MQKPDCTDKFVTRRKGKGKLGFPLTETTTIIMGDGKKKTSEFTTSLETLEFSAEKLDSMLFEIPPGYTQTMKEEDLQEKMSMKDMMEQYGGNTNVPAILPKAPDGILIGVYAPQGDEQLQAGELQQYLAGVLNDGKVQAVAVATEEEAKNMKCDYTLTTKFVRIKQASKMGGLLKAVKNADPNAASSFNMEAEMTLINLADGSTKLQPKVDGKFEGKINDAAKKALDDGGRQVLKGVK
jgi:hypothetical protein